MSSNMLQSVENFNVQANILRNYVRDVDICTQVYYSFIDTTWNFEDKFRYPNYVAKSSLLYNYHGVSKQNIWILGTQVWLLIFYSNTECPNMNCSYFYDFLGAFYGL
jgi:hypothetical protein